MNKNIEKIDRYLKGVALPEHTSEQHRRQLRRQILNRIERRQTMSIKVRSWKYAAVIALICTGVVAATVVGVKIHKWRFVGKHPEAGYILQSEDGRTTMTTNVPDSWTDSPEHAVEVKEELDLLKQQDAGELVGVVEKEVNGKLISRYFRFKYVLSDGREIKSGDYDPDFHESTTEAQDEELISLLRKDEFVTIGYEEKEFRGLMFSFERNRFVLSDGTEVIWSVGRPSEDSQNKVKTIVKDAKEADQILKDKREIAILRQQDKRKLIGVDELVANGELDRRVFVYQYQLSDGRTMDLREGDELNFAINKEQRQEWVQCKNSGSGEELGTYEQKFKDRLFVFKRQRFVLNDGTELIWSYGTLKDDQ
ncbi:MAG: hypothetical protein GY774_03465 [Planctomycetes bacterium]|nr:hypothetical protein [Planctomycetota bacterium]